MAKQLSIQARVQAFAAELLAEQAQRGDETIDDIEEAGVEIGDLVARAIMAEKLVLRLQDPPEHSPCPHCGRPSEPAKERRRKLLTRRGEVLLTEAKYRCPNCRRHFFPSDPSVGD